MDDIKLLQDRIEGLKGRRDELRKDQSAFIKAQGMDEEALKLQNEAERYKLTAQKCKGIIAELIAKKTVAVRSTADAFSARMAAVLPEGKAIFTIDDDGNVFLGWQRADGQTIPYAGLSGGEKVTFDAALVASLKANVIIVEAAELDAEHLEAALEKYGEAEGVQVLVSTCYPPATVPQGWEVIRV